MNLMSRPEYFTLPLKDEWENDRGMSRENKDNTKWSKTIDVDSRCSHFYGKSYKEMGFVVTCLSTRDVFTTTYKNLIYATLATL